MSYGSDVTCIFARNRSHQSKIHQAQLTASEKCILVSNWSGRNCVGSVLADPIALCHYAQPASRAAGSSHLSSLLPPELSKGFWGLPNRRLFPSPGCIPCYGAHNVLAIQAPS